MGIFSIGKPLKFELVSSVERTVVLSFERNDGNFRGVLCLPATY